MANFENQCLEAHNKYRRQHHVPELQLNKQLSAFAREWAEKLAKSRQMQHRSNNKYGENIFMAQGMQNITGEQVVKCWYDEINSYNYAAARFTPNSGHFTQVVWKNSKELGVGLGINGNLTIVVCNYDPPGNVVGQFSDNVLKR